MASGQLNNSKIQKAREINNDINTNTRQMKEESQVLSDIVKNLDEWAKETPIGNINQSQLKDLISELNRLMDHTGTLYNDVETFLDTQYQINNG